MKSSEPSATFATISTVTTANENRRSDGFAG